jgi:hypothetical protein
MKKSFLIGTIIFFTQFMYGLSAKEQLFFSNCVWDDHPTDLRLIVTESGICYYSSEFLLAKIKTYYKKAPEFIKGLGVSLYNKPYRQDFKHSFINKIFSTNRIAFEKSPEGWSAYSFEYDTDFEYTFPTPEPKTIRIKAITVVIREYPDETNKVRYYFWPNRSVKE